MPLMSASRAGGMGSATAPAPRGGTAVLRHAAPALVIFIAIRALCLAVLAIWSAAAGRSAHTLLSARWDSLWYVRVAEHGYGFSLTAPDGRNLSSMAFFPLFPWLEKSLSAIDSATLANSGLVISAVASVAAAWGMFAIADLSYGRRVGVILVALWAAVPVGIVQSMAYSESLFAALAAWALHAVLKGRWLLAGSLACLAGLTRPVGLAVSAALIATVALGAILGSVPGAAKRWTGWRPQLSGEPGEKVRMVLGCVIAPLGAIAYIWWVGRQEGKPLGYLDVQAGWGNGFDGGISFSRFLTHGLPGAGALAAVALLALICLAIWPHWIGVRQKQPLPLIVYSAVVTVLAVGASGYFGSKPRLLLPAFPLLLPLAVLLARSHRRTVQVTLTLASLAAAVYGAFWLNGSGPP